MKTVYAGFRLNYNSCPSINKIRSTGEFPIRKCEFLREPFAGEGRMPRALAYKQEDIMARITVEDCLGKVDNRFKLIHLAAKRVRQLRKGAEPLVESKNKDIVVSLREIAAGKVFQVENSDGQNNLIDLGMDPEIGSLPEPAAEPSPEENRTNAEGEEKPVEE